MALCFALVLNACGEVESANNTGAQHSEKAAMASRGEASNRIENWLGTWTGVRPESPLRNSAGEVIVIGGKQAKVSSSTFAFTIAAEGKASLVQSHEDGRIANFSGTWQGRMNSGTNELTAVVFDLAAQSTGAYRQYALVLDSGSGSVWCHGAAAEPKFIVTQEAH